MLPGTTAAGGEVWTRRRLAEWRWRNQASYLADIIALLRFEDTHCDLIARGGVRHHYGFTRIPANPVRTVGESVDIENYRIVDIVLRHLCTNLGKPDFAALDPGYVCCLRTRDKEN
jgi:hypothetical protein